jgi:hypothetical protein
MSSGSAGKAEPPTRRGSARAPFCAPACAALMSVDLMLPASEKITLVLETIGDDKIRGR